MKSDIKLLFYAKCWLEMKCFLADVVRKDAEEYPYVRDVLKLMRLIERKHEGGITNAAD